MTEKISRLLQNIYSPTGKKFTEAGVCISRIVDGKIVEEWGVTDYLDFCKQLGVIEYKGFPDEVR